MNDNWRLPAFTPIEKKILFQNFVFETFPNETSFMSGLRQIKSKKQKN